jgi:ParB/RepB/Spo0J family partition protein
MEAQIVTPAPTPTLPLSLIDTAPQVRKKMNKDELQDLANDIAAHGVLQPITVRQVGERFRVVFGHRRRFACEIAGLKEIPAIIRATEENDVTELQLVENLQREDLDADDIGLALAELYEKHASLESVALIVNKSKSWVAKHIKIATRLEYEVRQLFEEGVTEDGDYLCALSDLMVEMVYDWEGKRALMKEARAGKLDRHQVRERLARIKAEKAEAAAAKPSGKPAREKKPRPRSISVLAGEMQFSEEKPAKVFAGWMEKEQAEFVDAVQMAYIEGCDTERAPAALSRAAATYEKPALNLARMMGFLAPMGKRFELDEYFGEIERRFPRRSGSEN